MENNKPYRVLAFYRFCKVEDPSAEIAAHKEFFEGRDITSRIYISEEGINGQMCAHASLADDYISWLQARPPFEGIVVKVDQWHEQVFPRQVVKYRNQLVAIDEEIDLSLAGELLSPEKWQEKLEDKNEPYILVDVRNKYESEIGHFEGAELPQCETFREFGAYADSLAEKAQNTPVMMYCTGGIRCELYSALLRKKGVKTVYQLDGGVVNYGHKVGSKHWKGKLFVFDDRMAIPISEEPLPPVSRCHCCQEPVDEIYNCANMDCNNLFISCRSCLEESSGCCCAACQEAPRIRPYRQLHPHKPFRRAHLQS